MADDCGCSKRKEWLNVHVNGLGNAVEYVAEPVANLIGYKGRDSKMGSLPGLLKPDMKSLIWLAIGTLVVSKFIKI